MPAFVPASCVRAETGVPAFVPASCGRAEAGTPETRGLGAPAVGGATAELFTPNSKLRTHNSSGISAGCASRKARSIR